MARINYQADLIAFLVTGVIFIVGCGTASQESPRAPETEGEDISSKTLAINELEISNFAFSPETVTVPVGATVTWYNRDSASHTLTSRETLFDSGGLALNESFSYTFSLKGTYEYYCAIHPYMRGTVIVK